MWVKRKIRIKIFLCRFRFHLHFLFSFDRIFHSSHFSSRMYIEFTMPQPFWFSGNIWRMRLRNVMLCHIWTSNRKKKIHTNEENENEFVFVNFRCFVFEWDISRCSDVMIYRMEMRFDDGKQRYKARCKNKRIDDVLKKNCPINNVISFLVRSIRSAILHGIFCSHIYMDPKLCIWIFDGFVCEQFDV